jgi:hypothetical protein
MTAKKNNPKPDFRQTGGWVNSALLAVCLCILILRTVVTETPVARFSSAPMNVYDLAYSLVVSAILIVLCAIWLARSFCMKQRTYQKTGLEMGLGLWMLGAVLASLFAVDKRSALNECVIFVAPILLCFTLIGVLETPNKVRLVLITLGALGIVSVYECLDQRLYTNQATIEQYQENPDEMINQMGLDPGTLEHFMFEHRLYSKGINAFFTNRNSAASFLLMSLTAVLALWFEITRRVKQTGSAASLRLLFPIVTGVLLIGLVLTKSKAALGSLLLMSLCGVMHARWGPWIGRHKIAIACSVLLIGLVAGGLLLQYGLTHDRLPGGNSMLVRWQYWRAAGQMIADHPVTGVGPGNFASTYHRYKSARAIESVSDPHSIVLSLLSQYGMLGLIGFTVMLAIPLKRAIACVSQTNDHATGTPQTQAGRHFFGYTFLLATFLLLAKPVVSQLISSVPFMPETALVVVFASLVHTLLFIIGLLVLVTAVMGSSHADTISSHPKPLIWVLVYGITAILIGNLTDFAIFEPGVMTCFWALLACLIASLQQQAPTAMDIPATKRIRPNQPIRLALAIALVLAILGGLGNAVLPVLRSSDTMQRSNLAMVQGLPQQQVHALLEEASRQDPWADAATYRNGRLYLHDFYQMERTDRQPLKLAKACFIEAIKRNRAGYKNYEKLSNVHKLLGEMKEAQAACEKSVDLYPQSGKLHYELATLYEQLGDIPAAMQHYQEAIAIETAFREQFKVMYPDYTKSISRLGSERYDSAQDRLAQLKLTLK